MRTGQLVVAGGGVAAFLYGVYNAYQRYDDWSLQDKAIAQLRSRNDPDPTSQEALASNIKLAESSKARFIFWFSLATAGAIVAYGAYTWHKEGGIARENPTRRRHGGRVQSLLFPRDKFDVSQAKAWADKHRFKHGKVDVTDAYIRLRQLPPGRFKRMRTVPFGSSGIKGVIGFGG